MDRYELKFVNCCANCKYLVTKIIDATGGCKQDFSCRYVKPVIEGIGLGEPGNQVEPMRVCPNNICENHAPLHELNNG